MKAIWSKRNIENCEDNIAVEYFDCVKDLIENPLFLQTKNYTQHCNTIRFQHCLNVSYYSFLWAKKRNLDYKSCARAALLHDFFLYQTKELKANEHHAFYHPKEAILNAKKITTLNNIEENSIANHMWPLSKSFPKYKEGWVLTWVDKCCAISEVFYQVFLSPLKNVYYKFKKMPLVKIIVNYK